MNLKPESDNPRPKDLIKGVMPTTFNECIIHKTVPKSQKSFRITTALLKNLCDKAEKINKQGKIVILMQDGDVAYEVLAFVKI